MTPYENQLRECLEILFGGPLPERDYEPFLFFKQWLAERNLGLRPDRRARPSSPGPATGWRGFARPTAITRSSCSALRPGRCTMRAARSQPADGSRKAGCSTSLDVRLPIEEPYGRERRVGRVEAILIAPEAEGLLARVDRIEAVAGRGLEGDRYFEGRGTF